MPWTLVFSLVVFAPIVAINIYIGKTIFRALVALTGWSRKILKRVIVILLVYVNLLPLVFLAAYLAAGRGAVPYFAGDVAVIDILLTYPFWIALIISVQLLLGFAVVDVVDLFLKWFAPSSRQAWNRRTPAIQIAYAVFVTLYSLVVIFLNTWTVRVVERDVRLPEQFKPLSGFRIVQISDVQGDGRTTPEILRAYVQKVNALKPDIVLFAGDLVTSGTRYIDSTAAILGELNAPYGAVAAIGDHDIFSRKSMVLEALKSARILVVEDTTVVATVNQARLAIAVITYTYGQRTENERLQRILEESAGSYRILLVHQPAEMLVEKAANAGFNLFIAGHTHGGGIAFGIPGLFLLAPANVESRYVSGFYEVGSLLVSVTNGLGFTLAPVRFHAPAEIVVLTLR
jgi:predicted MPP superfamily phosphohydrolase